MPHNLYGKKYLNYLFHEKCLVKCSYKSQSWFIHLIFRKTEFRIFLFQNEACVSIRQSRFPNFEVITFVDERRLATLVRFDVKNVPTAINLLFISKQNHPFGKLYWRGSIDRIKTVQLSIAKSSNFVSFVTLPKKQFFRLKKYKFYMT